MSVKGVNGVGIWEMCLDVMYVKGGTGMLLEHYSSKMLRRHTLTPRAHTFLLTGKTLLPRAIGWFY